MTIIEEDRQFGVRLSSRSIGHPEREVILFEVHELVGGQWLGIGNDDHAGLESAQQRYHERLAELQGTHQ